MASHGCWRAGKSFFINGFLRLTSLSLCGSIPLEASIIQCDVFIYLMLVFPAPL